MFWAGRSYSSVTPGYLKAGVLQNGKKAGEYQDMVYRTAVVDGVRLPMPGGGDVLCGQLPRRRGGIHLRPATAHLLRPAGPEAGGHQL